MSTQTPGAPRAVTLSDVARLAGVSVATASKALNGRGDVAARTRVRVREAAEQLSFVPNPMAQGLLAGRTGTVGLLTSDLQGRFVLPILMGAEDAFGAGQVNVFLCDARGDAIREQYQLKALLSRRVDGLIVVGSRTDARPSLGQDLPVPVVYVYGPSVDPADTSLVSDNVAAGRMAAEHLLSCGRTRIAHVTGDPGYAAARDRARGVREALADAGVELVGDVLASEWSEAWGRSASSVVLDRTPDVDAIVCGSDQIARGALDTLRDAGRAVPEDVAVIGFDNWDAMVEQSRPRLSSLDPNLMGLGRAAAQQVFAALDGERLSPGVHTQEPRLVIRGSTVASR
ncbi:LacI family DNA-binding transcriptional regulator [Phycicoccus sp. BSK3Z-2]|uniref:LacI family DNA-binding transcriptional regulator n=1 Tax=Phycicoccus avicenniae TaxID=2828860 RepID=A0A941HYN3_9MICO|nr:LacI family DNA-binding transcriptional regulator [Phycicoccus avicenniae]MBR7742027.1 LacI family DNA-binding transcriptional regulator [Phycicoccus avicenniae]